MHKRYESGLAQIFEAEAQVSVMKTELIELQPVLAKTQKETDEILVIVDKVGPGIYCSPRHLARFKPTLLKLQASPLAF
jgi:hypothetical protein